jgi:hypothetical protein
MGNDNVVDIREEYHSDEEKEGNLYFIYTLTRK